MNDILNNIYKIIKTRLSDAFFCISGVKNDVNGRKMLDF